MGFDRTDIVVGAGYYFLMTFFFNTCFAEKTDYCDVYINIYPVLTVAKLFGFFEFGIFETSKFRNFETMEF